MYANAIKQCKIVIIAGMFFATIMLLMVDRSTQYTYSGIVTMLCLPTVGTIQVSTAKHPTEAFFSFYCPATCENYASSKTVQN
jgi:hypothetical protein